MSGGGLPLPGPAPPRRDWRLRAAVAGLVVRSPEPSGAVVEVVFVSGWVDGEWVECGSDEMSGFIEGRTSFFCFEAGRISSRSTGTPRETRKSRLMRDLTQFWGWRGGGATSWDHRERERSVLKIAEAFGIGSTGGSVDVSFVVGKSVSRWVSREVMMSGADWEESSSMRGCCWY